MAPSPTQRLVAYSIILGFFALILLMFMSVYGEDDPSSGRVFKSPSSSSSSSSSLLSSSASAGTLTSKQHTLVTGANKGIGFGVVQKLCEEGTSVVGTVRSAEKGVALQTAIAESHPKCDFTAAVLDMETDATVVRTLDALKGFLTERKIHLNHAVLNAAVNPPEPWDAAAIESFVQINYKSTMKVLRFITENAEKNATVLVVLSNYAQFKHIKDKRTNKQLRAADTIEAVDAIADNYIQEARKSAKGVLKVAFPYALSKNLAAALVRIEAKRVAGSIVLNGVHPGSVKTTMNTRGKLQPMEAAAHITKVLRDVATSGDMYTMGRKIGWSK